MTTIQQDMAVEPPAWLREARRERSRRYHAVTWVEGAWYAIYDEGDQHGVAGAQIYECHIDERGEVFLSDDQPDCDRGIEREWFDACTVFTSRTIVVRQ